MSPVPRITFKLVGRSPGSAARHNISRCESAALPTSTQSPARALFMSLATLTGMSKTSVVKAGTSSSVIASGVNDSTISFWMSVGGVVPAG